MVENHTFCTVLLKSKAKSRQSAGSSVGSWIKLKDSANKKQNHVKIEPARLGLDFVS